MLQALQDECNRLWVPTGAIGNHDGKLHGGLPVDADEDDSGCLAASRAGVDMVKVNLRDLRLPFLWGDEVFAKVRIISGPGSDTGFTPWPKRQMCYLMFCYFFS